MVELRWTTKKTGVVLQYRFCVEPDQDYWTEWTDVADVNGDVPRIELSTPDANEGAR